MKNLIKYFIFTVYFISLIFSKLETQNFFLDIFNQLSFQIFIFGILILIISLIFKELILSIFYFFCLLYLSINILIPCNNCNALQKNNTITDNKIRLMTFNTSYDTNYKLPDWFIFLENTLISNKKLNSNKSKELEELKKLILFENPDVILFQETNLNFINSLKDLNLNFPYQVQPNKFVNNTESIILSKYPIIKNENLSHNSILTKIIIDKFEINILSPHLHSGLNQKKFILAMKQIEILKQIRRDIGENIILMGDLNMTPISKRFNRLLEDLNLYTYNSFLKPVFSWPVYLPYFIGIQIDHVLYSKNFKMINKKTAISPGSDHRPLIVDLAF